MPRVQDFPFVILARGIRAVSPRWARLLSTSSIALVVCTGCVVSPSEPMPEEILARTQFHFSNPLPRAPESSLPLYLELDRLHTEGGVQSAARRIREVQDDPGHIPTYAIWLRDQYMHGTSPDALYGLLYFDALVALNRVGRNDIHGPTLQDTMILMVFVSSQLLGIENVARCAQQPNGTRYRFHWARTGPRGQHARRVWDGMPVDRRVFSLRFAKARVESAESRPPSPAACAAGMDATIAAMDAGLCRRVPASEVPNAEDYFGGSQAEFMDCDSERFATFVDDATWVERRTRVRKQYWDQLFAD